MCVKKKKNNVCTNINGELNGVSYSDLATMKKYVRRGQSELKVSFSIFQTFSLSLRKKKSSLSLKNKERWWTGGGIVKQSSI